MGLDTYESALSAGIEAALKLIEEDKQKFIGNAVEVNMARALCESLASAV